MVGRETGNNLSDHAFSSGSDEEESDDDLDAEAAHF
jgi:hypothetical protein